MQYIKLAAITGLLASGAVAAPSTVVSSAVAAPTHSAGPAVSHASLPAALPSLDLKSLLGQFKSLRPEPKTHHPVHHPSGHKDHKEHKKCSKTHHYTHTKTHTKTHHSTHTHTETHHSTHTIVHSSLPGGATTLLTISKSSAASVPVAKPSTY